MKADSELPMNRLCGFAGIACLACPLFAFAIYLTSLVPDAIEEWGREPEDLMLMGSYAFLCWFLGGIALLAGWVLLRSPSVVLPLWLIRWLSILATSLIGIVMVALVVAEGGLGVILLPPSILFLAMTIELFCLSARSGRTTDPEGETHFE